MINGAQTLRNYPIFFSLREYINSTNLLAMVRPVTNNPAEFSCFYSLCTYVTKARCDTSHNFKCATASNVT